MSLYEKQGILEDVDSDHRDGADGTGNIAGSIQLYVNGKKLTGKPCGLLCIVMVWIICDFFIPLQKNRNEI